MDAPAAHTGTCLKPAQLFLSVLLSAWTLTGCQTDCDGLYDRGRQAISEGAAGCEEDADCAVVAGPSCFPAALCGAAVHRDNQASVQQRLNELGEEYTAGQCGCVLADCIEHVSACVEGTCVMQEPP